MVYFNKVKEGQEVFGLIFGRGIVRSVWKDSFYTFEVQYENGQTVPYTPEGSPAWCNNLDYQTVFYKKDIDLEDLDFSVTNEILSVKKIIKLRMKKKLEVKCPSGVWKLVDDCPRFITEENLENNRFDLFRKKI